MSKTVSKPLIVATVSSMNDLAKLEQTEIQPTCDCLEFRVDSLLQNQALPAAEASLLRGFAPSIITVRHPSEGGGLALEPEERAALYLRYLDLAWAIDIEIGTIQELPSVISAVIAGKPLLIASFHDFERLPETLIIEEKIAQGIAAGADIVKIAARLHSQDDLSRLISLLQSDRAVPLSVMGMGALGQASRILAAKSGSVLNYGYLTEPNAPGQCSAEVLKQLISD